MFRILLVCTGNRCRSPVAKALLERLAADLPVEIDSAGLLDLGAAPPLDEILQAGAGAGIDLSAHRAQALSTVGAQSFDLILGLERRHVAAVVVDASAPAEKTFTLRELARLLDDVELPPHGELDQRARAAVAAAHRARVKGDSFVAGEDVEDPFGGPPRGYRAMIEEVDSLCRKVAAGLFGLVSAR